MGWGNIYRRRMKVFTVAFIIYLDYKALQQREKWISKSKRNALWDRAHERNARRVLNLIVELEGLWVKLGQYLSTRADVLPEAYVVLLKQLQDSLPPRPLKEVCRTIKKELGKSMGDLFSTFFDTPLATASDAASFIVKNRNLKLRDRDLRLYHAKTSSTPSKRGNPTSAEGNITPAKKLATGSKNFSDSSQRVKTKSAISYQGLRASKSGAPKKGRLLPQQAGKPKSKTPQKENNTPKDRQTKRPAVAARKAKINAVKAVGGGGSKQAGKKRKLESRTPENGRRSKKAKNFR